jgi:hypothetical protein
MVSIDFFTVPTIRFHVLYVFLALKRARSIAEFYIPSFEEMMALLAYANSRYALAA